MLLAKPMHLHTTMTQLIYCTLATRSIVTSFPISRYVRPLSSQLSFQLLVQLGELIHGKLLLRPANDKTLLVGIAGLRDNVEMDVVDDLVGDAAVVLERQASEWLLRKRKSKRGEYDGRGEGNEGFVVWAVPTTMHG